MVDFARLGLAVDSSQVDKGTVSLHQLTGAAGQASAAAQRLAGASQAEAAGQKMAAAATQTHTAALHANNAAMRMNNQVRTNMIYQLNDVGVSLASGMNPVMVAIQQLPQMLQFGLKPAIDSIVGIGRSLLTTFTPLLAVVGGLSILLQGMTNEINAVSGANVTLIDTTLAVFQSIADGVHMALLPAFAFLATEWDNAVNGIYQSTAREVNAIIGLWVGSVEAVKEVWGVLPDALGYIAYEASANVVNTIVKMVADVQAAMNDLFSSFDTAIVKMGGKSIMPRFDLSKTQSSYITGGNPYEGVAGAVDKAGAAFGAAQGKDYVGDWMVDIGQRAQDIAKARKETDELGGSAKAANDNIKAMNDSAKSLAETWGGSLKSAWQGFFSDFSNGIKQGKGFWEALGDAGMNALDKITSKALEMATNGIWDLIMGALGPTLGFGSFGIGGGMSGTSSITGSSGGFFPGFAGGGYTGDGARAGGLDGQGGFLAMLHPRETVTDHTRSQATNSHSDGGTSVVRIELGPDLEGRILQQSGAQSIQIVQASASSIAEQGANGALSKLGSGEGDASMRRFGMTAQAKRR